MFKPIKLIIATAPTIIKKVYEKFFGVTFFISKNQLKSNRFVCAKKLLLALRAYNK
ncbi:MAG: hypothetical protein ACRC2T_07450 [Thermoguttaceae bacterium]